MALWQYKLSQKKNLTDPNQVYDLMSLSKTTEDWEQNFNSVKAANGGNLPSFWQTDVLNKIKDSGVFANIPDLQQVLFGNVSQMAFHTNTYSSPEDQIDLSKTNQQVLTNFSNAVKAIYNTQEVKAKLRSNIPLYQQFPREFPIALQKSLSFQLFRSGIIQQADCSNPAKVQRVAIRIFEILNSKGRIGQGTYFGDLKASDVFGGIASGIQKVTNQLENIPAVRSGIPVK
jgi:hypothetical protein